MVRESGFDRVGKYASASADEAIVTASQQPPCASIDLMCPAVSGTDHIAADPLCCRKTRRRHRVLGVCEVLEQLDVGCHLRRLRRTDLARHPKHCRVAVGKLGLLLSDVLLKSFRRLLCAEKRERSLGRCESVARIDG